MKTVVGLPVGGRLKVDGPCTVRAIEGGRVSHGGGEPQIVMTIEVEGEAAAVTLQTPPLSDDHKPRIVET